MAFVAIAEGFQPGGRLNFSEVRRGCATIRVAEPWVHKINRGVADSPVQCGGNTQRFVILSEAAAGGALWAKDLSDGLVILSETAAGGALWAKDLFRTWDPKRCFAAAQHDRPDFLPLYGHFAL